MSHVFDTITPSGLRGRNGAKTKGEITSASPKSVVHRNKPGQPPSEVEGVPELSCVSLFRNLSLSTPSPYIKLTVISHFEILNMYICSRSNCS